MTLHIKQGQDGARVAGLRPEIIIALMVASEIYHTYDLTCELTCGTDSKHKEGSLHYVGLAIDIALPPANVKDKIFSELRMNLEDEFDVVLEGNHIHIEFQPKKGLNLYA